MPNIDSGCVLFDKITEHVCRITPNGPDVGNARDFRLTYALNPEMIPSMRNAPSLPIAELNAGRLR
jgi:hypothetical protein